MQYKYAVHILMSTHMTEAIGPSHHHMQHICTFKQNEQVADTKKEERYIYLYEPGLWLSMVWVRTLSG
jgi:hypothetical protein